MALKTATIFKDFTITANGTNTAVKFVKNEPKTISVKNDNFAQQVQIYDSADTTDFFSYKYITFDNSAVFEITDCIKNEKFTTLFIQYLSNISFNSNDSNFKVSGVTASTLQKLGLDLNDFLQILGNDITTSFVNHNNFNDDATAQEPFMFALRLKFSQLPDNLTKRYTGSSNSVTDGGGIGSHNRSRVYNVNKADMTNEPSFVKPTIFNDNKYIILMPIPQPNRILYIKWGDNHNDYTYSLYNFFITLNNLISDLLESITLTILNNKSIFASFSSATPHLHNITFTHKYKDNKNYSAIIIPKGPSENSLTAILELIRCTSESGSRGVCFVIASYTTAGPNFETCILTDVLNFVKLSLPTRATNEKFLTLECFGNIIDLKNLKNDYIYIKRDDDFLRFYIDIYKNLFTDIQTSIEIEKNEFSNYLAYKRANIELVNKQAFDAFKLQQKAKDDQQRIEFISSTITATKNFISSAGLSLVNDVIKISTQEQKYNAQQQIEYANFKLLADQEHEKARAIITPTEILSGDLRIENIFKSAEAAYYGSTAFIFQKISLSNEQKETLRQYLFDNAITSKVSAAADIITPNYLPDTLMQFKIANRDPRNTRKGLIVLGKKGS